MKHIQSFFLGIFGALGALFLEVLFLAFLTSSSSNTETIVNDLDSIGLFFFLAILAEELLKYILIYKSIAKKNIISNSLFFGFGFSMLEMFFIYWNYRNGNLLDLSGILGILTIHISTATLMGYSVRKNTVNFISGIFFGFIPAFLIHLAYNFLKITEIAYQKEFTIALLALLIFMDIFILIKSKIACNIEPV